MPSAADNLRWLESLTPWPEEFGLGRMRKLLRRLGDPQLAYRAIHVVGTNGKTTTTRMIEAVLEGEGLLAGVYTSPHVTTWAERIRVGGEEADMEAALARVRRAAEEAAATQFEVLTAAALAEFAAVGVEVAVVEAGLGGRLDATNVLQAPVVVLTNVALDHIDVLGGTREEIAEQKLAVLTPGAVAVVGEAEWEEAARGHGAGGVVVAGHSNLALAIAASETLLGRPVSPPAEEVYVPGRFERVSEQPLEIWDGAHNLAGVGWLLPRLPGREDYTLVVSVLEDKDARGMLAGLSPLGRTLVATRSSNDRALPATELARLGEAFFEHVEVAEQPVAALDRARAFAGTDGAVLVTGSLYLLADLVAVRPPGLPWQASASG